MSAPAPRPRLATDRGRCVIRLSKQQRLAGTSIADAARLKRALAEIYREGVHAFSESMVAERVADTALAFAGSQADPALRLALAREASLSAGAVAKRLSELLTRLERIPGGLPCR